MNDILPLAGAALAGLVLGGVFFGGLWWTVHRALVARHAATWLFGSSLLRTGLAVTGFYWIGATHWLRLVICLLGFVGMRLLLTALARMPARVQFTAGDGHAS